MAVCIALHEYYIAVIFHTLTHRLCLEHQKAPNCLKLKLGLSSPKLDSKTTEESNTALEILGFKAPL